jgi:hypothetical protein
MIEGSGSDQLREQVPHKPRPTSALPLGSRFETVANQPLNPQLVEKIGTIRRIRRWLERDLASFVIGFSAQVGLGALAIATILLEGEQIASDVLVAFAITTLCCAFFSALCLILASFLVEHVKLIGRWRGAYIVVLVVWATLWWFMAENIRDNWHRGVLTLIWVTGFATLPCASLLSCIPLAVLGAITSITKRRESKAVGGATCTVSDNEFPLGVDVTPISNDAIQRKESK